MATHEPAGGYQRYAAALHPDFIRKSHAKDCLLSNRSLDVPANVEALTISQSRSLTGRQIDAIIRAKLGDLLGTKWLMKAQECWYRPLRPARAGPRYSNTLSEDQAEDDSLDIALLMVDNRKPLPYEVAGTRLRSPDEWGLERQILHPERPPRSSTASPFQMSVIINHIYSQLHGYRFYLESLCKEHSIGVDNGTWSMVLADEHLTQYKFYPFRESHQVYMSNDVVCPKLDKLHRLGPFPPRGPPWMKVAALRYLLRRHAFVAYLDSDVFITEVWQPMEPLLDVIGLKNGSKWIAAAEEFPPQKLRRDYRAGLANSGVLLMAGAPIAGSEVLVAMEEWIWPKGSNPFFFFKWPFEQNALTRSVFQKYPNRYVLLKPGCPINSPFGAFIRHMVGGSPQRGIYHPDHRPPWLLQALQCTLRGFIAEKPTVERCTPNEPTVELDAAGCDEMAMLKHKRPVAPTVISRLRVPDWQACCAFCNADDRCRAFSFHANMHTPLISCWLLEATGGVRADGHYYTGSKLPGSPKPIQTFVVPRPLYVKRPAKHHVGSDRKFKEAKPEKPEASQAAAQRAAFATD